MFTEATPAMMLAAYRQGIFPMADTAASRFYHFYRPEKRGLLPIHDLHIPKSLHKVLKKNRYQLRIDTAFAEVITHCAQSGEGREQTWINDLIRDVFIELHALGHAHSVECWDGPRLVGGLYGLAIGAVFCGESMFSLESNASKLALVHLCRHLDRQGFTVLDTQFINPHLQQFGAYEVRQEDYEALIDVEMNKNITF